MGPGGIENPQEMELQAIFDTRHNMGEQLTTFERFTSPKLFESVVNTLSCHWEPDGCPPSAIGAALIWVKRNEAEQAIFQAYKGNRTKKGAPHSVTFQRFGNTDLPTTQSELTRGWTQEQKQTNALVAVHQGIIKPIDYDQVNSPIEEQFAFTNPQETSQQELLPLFLTVPLTSIKTKPFIILIASRFPKDAIAIQRAIPFNPRGTKNIDDDILA